MATANFSDILYTDMQMTMNEDIGRYSVRSGLLQNPAEPGLPQNHVMPQNRIISENRGIPQNQIIPQSQDITQFLYFASVPQSAVSPWNCTYKYQITV